MVLLVVAIVMVGKRLRIAASLDNIMVVYDGSAESVSVRCRVAIAARGTKNCDCSRRSEVKNKPKRALVAWSKALVCTVCSETTIATWLILPVAYACLKD